MQKRIKQEIAANSIGTIKDFKIDSISMISENTCYARHYFYNQMFAKNTLYYYKIAN